MTRKETIADYIKKYPELGPKPLARLIFKENPDTWVSINAIRVSIQRIIGSSGEKERVRQKDKSLFKQIPIDKEAVLQKIADQYNLSELQAISSGGRIMPGYSRVPVVNFNGTHFKIGAISDTHIGSKHFSKNRLFQAFEEFKKEGVDFVTHSGDVTEGMSNRPGQIYELDQIGYDNQRREAVNVLSHWDGKIYMIDGNHDRWYIKSNGALIVKDIASMLPDAEYLGHDEGDISLNSKASLKLWHGEDGSSYATSYRIQKVVESLSGGEKPNMMFFGHTHKSVYIFERNIHCYSMGCMESQSSWMRSKRLAAHTGFWVIDVWVNGNGISKSGGIFHPFYT